MPIRPPTVPVPVTAAFFTTQLVALPLLYRPPTSTPVLMDTLVTEAVSIVRSLAITLAWPNRPANFALSVTSTLRLEITCPAPSNVPRNEWLESTPMGVNGLLFRSISAVST